MSDPIADFCTRIRNAYMARHQSVVVPHSKLKLELAKLMADQGFIKSVEVEGKDHQKNLLITLAYHQDLPLLTHIKRVSKPSVRRYAKADSIPQALSGKGVTILSTSHGLLTGPQAQKAGVGGEILCQIW